VSAPRSDALTDAVARAYALFAAYGRPPALGLCTFCYTDADLAIYQTTALADLGPDHVRKLVWESADHWPSTDVYKHFLPRILDALAPPDRCDDLYPAHLFEVLAWHGIGDWPEAERELVRDYVQRVAEALEAVDDWDDALAWRDGAATLGLDSTPSGA
jgi:hypothetical protein